MSSQTMTPKQLAQLFHETYERLAPSYGYKTHDASAKPWVDVSEANRALMTATCAEVLAVMSQRPTPDLIPTDPPTFDATGNPRFKRLKLDPALADDQNWTIHDVPNQVLLDNIRAWMEEALAGDGITIEIVEMSDAEAEALPDV